MMELLICRSCIKREDADEPDAIVEALAQAAAAQGLTDEVTVRGVSCLGACNHPISLALQGKDKASYVFTDLHGQDWIPDAIATCDAYVAADDGWIDDRSIYGMLRFSLHAKIPALGAES